MKFIIKYLSTVRAHSNLAERSCIAKYYDVCFSSYCSSNHLQYALFLSACPGNCVW